MAPTATAERKSRKTRMRRAREKQMRIPGTEEVSIPEVDAAADQYVTARDDRMKMTEEEIQTHAKLLDVMKKHKLTKYKGEGFEISLDTTEKCKVKKVKDEKPDDAGDEEKD